MKSLTMLRSTLRYYMTSYGAGIVGPIVHAPRRSEAASWAQQIDIILARAKQAAGMQRIIEHHRATASSSGGGGVVYAQLQLVIDYTTMVRL